MANEVTPKPIDSNIYFKAFKVVSVKGIAAFGFQLLTTWGGVAVVGVFVNTTVLTQETLLSSALVSGPTNPVGVMLEMLWKDCTACLVCDPKYPVGDTFKYSFSARYCWRLVTSVFFTPTERLFEISAQVCPRTRLVVKTNKINKVTLYFIYLKYSK